MNAPPQFPLARSAYGPAPVRRPGSVRRTSTIDTSWPEGFGQAMRMEGHARDVLTPAGGGEPVVLAEDRYVIVASPRREILSLETVPARPKAQELVGIRAGGESRAALMRIMAAEREAGAPLYLILDDFAGASLVAGWVWSLWDDRWRERASESGARRTSSSMEGVCTGFAPGSSALDSHRNPEMREQSSTRVPSLVNPLDAEGWHRLGEQPGVGMRRARRIDLWRDGDAIAIDVGFQDSGTSPDGGDRIAIHEYHVTARAREGRLEDLKIDPRILPFRECPGAAALASRILDAPLAELRTQVLETLPGTLGCTHLNDVLRSMAEVPLLARHLPD
ncbi:DUF2889 domain-containing protein [Novosphingobium tardum]|uniref:DUF2889 domain-containing protein n=1 Tax=Novosphingobium tardum TaxID=1538021 RepID=A0ABV8RRS7_9SPHN